MFCPTSRLARAPKFSRLSQCLARDMLMKHVFFGPCLNHIGSICGVASFLKNVQDRINLVQESYILLREIATLIYLFPQLVLLLEFNWLNFNLIMSLEGHLVRHLVLFTLIYICTFLKNFTVSTQLPGTMTDPQKGHYKLQ